MAANIIYLSSVRTLASNSADPRHLATVLRRGGGGEEEEEEEESRAQ